MHKALLEKTYGSKLTALLKEVEAAQEEHGQFDFRSEEFHLGFKPNRDGGGQVFSYDDLGSFTPSMPLFYGVDGLLAPMLLAQIKYYRRFPGLGYWYPTVESFERYLESGDDDDLESPDLPYYDEATDKSINWDEWDKIKCDFCDAVITELQSYIDNDGGMLDEESAYDNRLMNLLKLILHGTWT